MLGICFLHSFMREMVSRPLCCALMEQKLKWTWFSKAQILSEEVKCWPNIFEHHLLWECSSVWKSRKLFIWKECSWKKTLKVVKWMSFWPNHFKWIYPVVFLPLLTRPGLCVCHLFRAMKRDLGRKAKKWDKATAKARCWGLAVFYIFPGMKSEKMSFTPIDKNQKQEEEEKQKNQKHSSTPGALIYLQIWWPKRSSSSCDDVRFSIFPHHPSGLIEVCVWF